MEIIRGSSYPIVLNANNDISSLTFKASLIRRGSSTDILWTLDEDDGIVKETNTRVIIDIPANKTDIVPDKYYLIIEINIGSQKLKQYSLEVIIVPDIIPDND